MSPRTRFLGSFLCFAAMLTPGAGPLFAAWKEGGVPVTAEGAQHSRRYPLVASDASGGAFVAWVTDDSISAGSFVNDPVVQHLGSLGDRNPFWPASGLWLSLARRPQSPSAVLNDGQGGTYVIWQDSRDLSTSNFDLYMARAIDGAIAPGWPADGLPVCTAPNYQEDVIALPDGSGGVFVLWNETRHALTSGDGADIYGTRVLPDGTFAPGWPVDGKPVVPPAGSQFLAGAIADGAGGVIIGFATGPSFGYDAYAVHIDGNGNPVPGWPSDIIPVSIGPGEAGGRIVGDGAGGFYMAWGEYRVDPVPPYPYFLDYIDVYGAHVLADGTLAPGWPLDGLLICNAPGGQYPVIPLADGAGGLLVAWEDFRPSAGGADIYVTRRLPDGSLAPGWLPNGNPAIVSTYDHYFTNVNFLAPQSVVSDGMGGMYLATVNGQATRGTAQHVLANGSLEPGWPPEGLLVPPQPTSGQDYVAIASDGYRGAIMVWPERRTSSFTNIYAAHIGPLGPTATVVSLVLAEAEPGLVRLRWHAADAAALPAVVQRRESSTEWAEIGPVLSDGSGLIAFEDRDVADGRRYAYRLAYGESGGMAYTPEAWVDVPARYELALAGLRPNPATRGELTVAFTLPDVAPARLELLDVTGRRVASRDVGALGAGRHAVRLDEGHAIAAGVYWVRLSHPSLVLTARGVVLR